MKYEIIFKGKVKAKFKSLFAEYIKRIDASEKTFDSWEGVEKHLNSKPFVLLSEKGIQMSSLEFTHFIKKKSESGIIRFVFGDENGFPIKIIEKAGFVLSLSEMTLPHDLSKIVLLEQLYRSESILRNKSYHR